MLTHRRTTNELSDRAIIIQFCEDEQNEHYGPHVWELKSELPYVGEMTELIEYAAEYYEVSIEEARELVNPDNIVNTAAAWDDEDFVEAVWNRFEPVGFRTYNGAVVIDREEVKMEYRFEN
jgi:hypothetical protein